jgi:hypothetical protein
LLVIPAMLSIYENARVALQPESSALSKSTNNPVENT